MKGLVVENEYGIFFYIWKYNNNKIFKEFYDIKVLVVIWVFDGYVIIFEVVI